MSMRSDLRRLSAVSLVTALTALTLGAAVGPASAEDVPATPAGPVGIGRALTNDAQRGSFKVTAWTDAPEATVTAVSAKVRQGDTVLAEIPALEENAASKGTFALPAVATLKLTEDGGTIPSLGKYAIDVTATDSLGNTVTRADAGTLDFTLKPRLNAFGIGDPSWADPFLHPKGALVGVQPGSGDEVPLSGRTVSYDYTGTDTTFGSAVTGETGEFTGEPVPVETRYASTQARFTEDSAEVHGTATYYAYTSGQQKQATVTASADKVRAASGELVTVSGRVTDPNAAGAPMADVPVSARLGGGLSKTVRTDAEGRFSVQLVAAPGRDPWGSVASGWSVQSESQFLSFYANGPLTLPADSVTTVVGYKLATDARLTVYGELRAPYETWLSTSSSQTVVLEQSPDGQTGWKQIASTSFYNNNVRTPFTIGAWNKGGWFRVRHLANDYFGESAGKPFYIVRTDSRVTGLKASPDPVAKGSAITVTGSLQHYTSGAWRGLGYQPVSVWFKPWGKTGTWKQVATGKSSSTGAVSVKTTAGVDGWYQIRYYGDGTHFQTFSGQDWVDVR